MRVLTKPSTALCTLEHYTAFLLAESQSAGCVRLAEVSGGAFAHDAANRFLNREEFSPRDLFEEARPLMQMAGGTLSVDDSVLEKPYSKEGKVDLVGYFWSSKAGHAVKGLCLVTLLHTDAKGFSCPVNFRLVDKAQGKTKNEHFRDMVEEVLAWGLRPAAVTADSWFSGVKNLKFLRDQGLGFLIALEKNRVVSEEARTCLPVGELELPAKGKVVHLRRVGFVTVFRTVDKHGTARHYAQYDPHKKAHESRLRSLPARARLAVEDRVLPPCAQRSLPRAPLLRALETSHRQPSLLLVARLPPTRTTTLLRADQHVVPVQTSLC